MAMTKPSSKGCNCCEHWSTIGRLKTCVIVICLLAIVCFTASHLKHRKQFHRAISLPSTAMKEIGTEQDLVHLAAKLSTSTGLTQSYEDSLALNSAYFEVMQLVDTLTHRRQDIISKLGTETGMKTTQREPLSNTVSIVANFVHNADVNSNNIVDTFMRTLHATYPDVTVIIGIPKAMQISNGKYEQVLIERFDNRESETDVWNHLLSSVTTSYVYVSRDIYKFSKDTRLESLVDILNTTMALAVSSASKDLHTGQWSNGCLQTVFQNYQLKYRHGYHTSASSCLVCHYLSGPFLTYTYLITKLVPLQKGMTDTSGFPIWFLELQRANRVVLSCPESMALASKTMELSTQHGDWIDLVKYHQVEAVYLPDKALLTFGCDEANTQCLRDHPPGTARSWCCLKELGDGVRLVMRECQAAGLFCELTDGTILGTLKFESSLPWEVDADLEVANTNYSAFKELIVPKLTKLGYIVNDHTSFETINGQISGWSIELFPIKALGSTRLRGSGVSVTQVLLDGEYISTCESPGLLGRNRYGHEIYQHANHWSKAGAGSGWAFYEPGKFANCTEPGKHFCLDQFRADGSTQFNIDRIEP